jgi:hypothetical protein
VRFEETGSFAVEGSKKSFDITHHIWMRADTSKPPAITWRNEVDDPKAILRVVYAVDGDKSTVTRWLRGQDTPVVDAFRDRKGDSWLPRFAREGLTAPYAFSGKLFSQMFGDPSFAVVGSKEVTSQGRKCVEVTFNYTLKLPISAVRSGRIVLSPEDGWVVHGYDFRLEGGAVAYQGTVKYRRDAGAGPAAAIPPPIASVELKLLPNRFVHEFQEFEFGSQPTPVGKQTLKD